MFEYIYSQITGEILKDIHAASSAARAESLLNDWRKRLKVRIRHHEVRIKKNQVVLNDSDYDSGSDSSRDIKEKSAFCSFLLEDFIDEQIAAVTGRSLSEIVAHSGSMIVNEAQRESPALRSDSVPPLEPFRWTGTRPELMKLVGYLAAIAATGDSAGPSNDEVVSVASMFADKHGKPFPLKLFLPETIPPAVVPVPRPSTIKAAKRKEKAKPRVGIGQSKPPKKGSKAGSAPKTKSAKQQPKKAAMKTPSRAKKKQ